MSSAARFGVDAVGFVFHAASPRAVGMELAGGLIGAMPPFVTSVGLFVDAELAFVREVLKQVPLDLLQFHGDEPADYCASFGRPWIKAIRMRAGVDLEAESIRYAAGAGLLLDTYDAAAPGGTGRRFDWERIPPALAPRIILAGGLDPENVGEAVRRVRPWGVDVSGGVEESRGVKDEAKIEAFLQGVRDGDESG